MTFQSPQPTPADLHPYKSMNLQTIPNQTRTLTRPKQSSLDISDIQGTRSNFIQKPRKIRQVYNNRNDDIQKSRSNILIPKQVKKFDVQLFVDDIQGTRTKVNKFVTTRSTNPLEPVYQLPAVQYAEYPEQKFIRDNMAIDVCYFVMQDIEGTRAKETFIVRLQREGKFLEKDNTLLQNRNKNKLQPRKNNFLFDVTDINNPIAQNSKPRNQRCTNPLQPVYKVASSKQTNFVITQIGFIQGTKPSQPKNRKTPIDYIYNVRDIPGAVSRQPKKYIPSKNQEIPEAKVGSYKRGISSNRKTNPLQPQYVYLGASQNKQNNYYSRPKTAAQRLDAFIAR